MNKQKHKIIIVLIHFSLLCYHFLQLQLILILMMIVQWWYQYKISHILIEAYLQLGSEYINHIYSLLDHQHDTSMRKLSIDEKTIWLPFIDKIYILLNITCPIQTIQHINIQIHQYIHMPHFDYHPQISKLLIFFLDYFTLIFIEIGTKWVDSLFTAIYGQ